MKKTDSNITLNTPITTLNIPYQIEKYWDDTILAKQESSFSLESYSPFKQSFNTTPKWHQLKVMRIFEIFKNLSDYYEKEKNHLIMNKNEKKQTYLIINTPEFLQKLSSCGLDIIEIIHNTISDDPSNKRNWQYYSLIELVNAHLKNKKTYMSEEYFDCIFNEKKANNRRHYHYEDINQEINTMLNILDNLPPKKVTYELFSHMLEEYCSFIPESKGDYEFYPDLLNFESQKKIKSYISTHFPEKIDENSKFYSDIYGDKKIFSFKQYFQNSAELNVYNILNQFDLPQEKENHISSLLCYTFELSTGKDFLTAIQKDYQVFNSSANNNGKNLKIQYSTEKEEHILEVENIIKYNFETILENSDKLFYRQEDGFSGAPEVYSNVNVDFLVKNYLNKKLQYESKDKNTNQKSFKI